MKHFNQFSFSFFHLVKHFIKLFIFHYRFTTFLLLNHLVNFSSSQYLNCELQFTTFVWGDYIDYLEWSCNLNDTEMRSSEFNESISYNNVTSMHIIRTTNTSLPTDLHQKFANLTSLRVELTDITSITKSDTEGLHNLKNFYLGNNNISEVSEDAFENFPKLGLFYLNGNKISRLATGTFQKLTNLERLWLNDNQLTELHSELLTENKNLNRLYLQNNKISVVGTETFSIPNLNIVDLRGNICINKWTFNTPMQTVKELTEKDCNPSVENMRKSSIVMAKIIHELSVRDIVLHNEIVAYEIEIAELRRRLEKYEPSQEPSGEIE